MWHVHGITEKQDNEYNIEPIWITTQIGLRNRTDARVCIIKKDSLFKWKSLVKYIGLISLETQLIKKGQENENSLHVQFI